MADWTPAAIATSLWLDANDGLTAAEWADKSGNGNNATQATSAYQPAVITDAQNGLPCARFDGVDDFYSCGDVLDLGTGGISIFVAAKFDGTADCGLVAKTLYAAATGRWSMHRVSSELRVFYSDASGNTPTASSSFTSTSPKILGGIIERSATAPAISSWVDGTHVGSATPAAEIVDLSTAYRLLIGAYNNATNDGQLMYFDGDMFEIIAIQGAVSTETRQKIEGYLAWKWGLEASLPSGHPYKDAAPSVILFLVAQLDQRWGIKLGADLVQNWSDATVRRAELYQPWGNAGVIKAQLVQCWRDMVTLRARLDQPWAIMESLLAALEQPWAITAGPVQALLSQGWDVKDVEKVLAQLTQPWSIASDGSVLRYTVEVLADGQPVRVSHVNIEGGLDQEGDVLTCEIRPETEAEFILCPAGAVLQVTITCQEGTDSFVFVVTDPRIDETHEGTNYVVEAMSPAVMLKAPYAQGIDGELSGLASEIASFLAGDLTVSWETVDWLIPAATWIASGETPMALLKVLASAVGAVVQSDPDGTIAIRPQYSVSVSRWALSAADLALTETMDEDLVLKEIMDCFTTGSTPDHRYGFNRFLISNQGSSADSLTLEETEISSTVKEVRGYQVPWDGLFDLVHTGGSWVVIEPMGIEEREENEMVEFVAGTGQTQYPIYGLASVDWQQVNLGTITTAEDGSLTAATAGQSLCEVTYATRCRLWKVKDTQDEQLQLVAEL